MFCPRREPLTNHATEVGGPDRSDRHHLHVDQAVRAASFDEHPCDADDDSCNGKPEKRRLRGRDRLADSPRSHHCRATYRGQAADRRPIHSLSAKAARDLGGFLRPPAREHPWPDEISPGLLGGFSKDKGPIRLTLVEPVVVEVSADVAWSGRSFRHPLRYRWHCRG